MRRPTVLLADDHPIVVEGLRSILEQEFDLVGTVKDGRALLAAAEDLKPDVILADISMPLLNGLEAVQQLKRDGPAVKVVFLTMHTDADMAMAAFEAGASGYVVKESAGEELVSAIHAVLNGRLYVSPALEKDVLRTFMATAGHSKKPSAELTTRQREVLQLVAEGRTMKEIAGILHLSIRTVESHKYAMMEQLGVETTADLIRYAVKRRIVSE